MDKPKRGRISLEVDKYLKDLKEESKNYLIYKNYSSYSIKRVEDTLRNLKANVSFSFLIDEDIEDDNKIIKWLLAWDNDLKSKNYGLNIIYKKFDDNNEIVDMLTQSFLISDIELRAKYSKYLITFVQEFTSHLAKLRIPHEQ